MSTPAPAWNQVPVVATWHNQDGTKKAGTYVVTIPERVVSTADDVIIPAGQFTSGTLNTSTGPSLNVMVPAMDDPDITPRGKDLVIVVKFDDGTPSETFKVSPSLVAGSLNLRTVPMPSSGSAPSNLAYIGVAGGVAKLDADGDVVDADGVKVTGTGDGTTTAAGITDATATGRSVLTAASQTAARTAIGAGTSSLILGTTSTTAKAGDYAPPAATSTVAGVVRLTGDLGGTSTAPTVPGLATVTAALDGKQDATTVHTLAQLAPGTCIVIDYYKPVYGAANAWPASRATNRTDLDVTWRGPTDPGAIMLAGDTLDLTGP